MILYQIYKLLHPHYFNEFHNVLKICALIKFSAWKAGHLHLCYIMPASYPGALIGIDVAWRARGRTRVGGRENSEQRTSIPARASRNQLAHQSARDEADIMLHDFGRILCRVEPSTYENLSADLYNWFRLNRLALLNEVSVLWCPELSR
jgi:hypothetical protein